MADYISREAARPDAFCSGVSCQECPFCKDIFNGGCRVDDFIMALPAANVRPVVMGKWEDETGYIFSILAQRVYCPVCKSYAYFSPITTKNFCPNCGADMREISDGDN